MGFQASDVTIELMSKTATARKLRVAASSAVSHCWRV